MIMNKKLSEIIKHFKIKGELIGIEENAQGNINSTYLLTFKSGDITTKYLLQKINSNVFRDPYSVMRNIKLITKHIQKKLKHFPTTNYRTLNFISTLDGELMYTCKNEVGEKEYYRMYEYIDNCVSYNTLNECENPTLLARNAGRSFGFFHKLLSDFPVNMLADTIPNFHNTPKRFEDLLHAIDNSEQTLSRVFENEHQITYYLTKRKEYSLLWHNLGKTLPIRVTHNDTKLNNILMNGDTYEGIAVIDLDTVMPGSFLFDIGDGIRSACSNSFEDEKDPEKIFLNLEYTKAYLEGYLEEMANFLTYEEVKHIALSIKVLTYELSIRFLTDHINNDIYFKVKYPGHNGDRALNQFKLLQDIEAKTDEIEEFVYSTYTQFKKK